MISMIFLNYCLLLHPTKVSQKWSESRSINTLIEPELLAFVIKRIKKKDWMKAPGAINIAKKRTQMPAAIAEHKGAQSKAVKEGKLCSRCKNRFESLSRHQPFCKGREPLTDLRMHTDDLPSTKDSRRRRCRRCHLHYFTSLDRHLRVCRSSPR